MTHIPSRQELDRWLEQATKSLRSAATKADARAVYRERAAQIAGWHPAVVKGLMERLAAVGKARFR